MNVIKFPNYINNYSSKWTIYEKSYLNSSYIDEYEIDDKDINSYVDEYEKIIKIKNNFYKMDENYVLNKLLKKLNNKFIERHKDNFNEIIINYIKTEKINNFAYYFLKTLKYDKERISIITNYVNSSFLEINFINNLKIINQILIEFEKIKDMDEIICLIHKNISKNLTDKFLNFVSNTDLNILSNLLKKINLFKKFYNYFDNSKKIIINKVILEKIKLNFNNKNLSNNNLANIIINIFDFLKNDKNFNEVVDVECDLLLDYINASIYFWILDNNYLNVETLILYAWNFLPKLSFLEYYKYHLQNRAIIIKNHELENNFFNKIVNIFNKDDLSNIIYEIKYILDDIYLSKLCNSEIRNIKVNVKYNFKDVSFDLNKCNLLICSNNLWNNNKNLYNNIKYVDNIGVYECIISKFYECKYSKKRKFNISNEESIININLWKNNIILPITYYNLLYKIGDSEIETSNNTFDFLRDSLNYDDDYLENIINIFKIKNLIREIVILNSDELNNYINIYYEKLCFKNLKLISKLECFNNLEDIKKIILGYIERNNLKINENCFKLNNILINILNIKKSIIYIINEELEYEEMYLNLVSVKKNEKKVLEKIEYDKNLLLDSKICELLKKNKELKYGKFLLNLRNNISKFFIPSDNEILKRLDRLIILGYIEKENDLYKYVE